MNKKKNKKPPNFELKIHEPKIVRVCDLCGTVLAESYPYMTTRIPIVPTYGQELSIPNSYNENGITVADIDICPMCSKKLAQAIGKIIKENNARLIRKEKQRLNELKEDRRLYGKKNETAS